MFFETVRSQPIEREARACSLDSVAGAARVTDRTEAASVRIDTRMVNSQGSIETEKKRVLADLKIWSLVKNRVLLQHIYTRTL